MSSTVRVLVAAGLALALGLLISRQNHLGAAQDASAPAVTLRMIEVGSLEAAQRILERLQRGERFVAVARAESTAPSAEIGGWLGKVTLAELRPEVRQALEGVKPGRTTPIVRIPTGFAIFKVEEDEPSDIGP